MTSKRSSLAQYVQSRWNSRACGFQRPTGGSTEKVSLEELIPMSPNWLLLITHCTVPPGQRLSVFGEGGGEGCMGGRSGYSWIVLLCLQVCRSPFASGGNNLEFEHGLLFVVLRKFTWDRYSLENMAEMFENMICSGIPQTEDAWCDQLCATSGVTFPLGNCLENWSTMDRPDIMVMEGVLVIPSVQHSADFSLLSAVITSGGSSINWNNNDVTAVHLGVRRPLGSHSQYCGHTRSGVGNLRGKDHVWQGPVGRCSSDRRFSQVWRDVRIHLMPCFDLREIGLGNNFWHIVLSFITCHCRYASWHAVAFGWMHRMYPSAHRRCPSKQPHRKLQFAQLHRKLQRTAMFDDNFLSREELKSWSRTNGNWMNSLIRCLYAWSFHFLHGSLAPHCKRHSPRPKPVTTVNSVTFKASSLLPKKTLWRAKSKHCRKRRSFLYFWLSRPVRTPVADCSACVRAPWFPKKSWQFTGNMCPKTLRHWEKEDQTEIETKVSGALIPSTEIGCFQVEERNFQQRSLPSYRHEGGTKQ